jgi:hypothetical protein
VESTVGSSLEQEWRKRRRGRPEREPGVAAGASEASGVSEANAASVGREECPGSVMKLWNRSKKRLSRCALSLTFRCAASRTFRRSSTSRWRNFGKSEGRDRRTVCDYPRLIWNVIVFDAPEFNPPKKNEMGCPEPTRAGLTIFTHIRTQAHH